MPDQEKNPAAIRLNVASIVREEHQLRAKEREEEQILKDLEVNLRDSTEFKLWKQRNQELERVQELEYLQKSAFFKDFRGFLNNFIDNYRENRDGAGARGCDQSRAAEKLRKQAISERDEGNRTYFLRVLRILCFFF